MTGYQKEIIEDLDQFKENDLYDPMFLLERIKKYDFGYFYAKTEGISDRFDPNYDEYESFIEGLYANYLDKYFQFMEGNKDRKLLSKCLKEFALSFDPKRYDILVRLGEVEIISKDAYEALKTSVGEEVNKEALAALARCYYLDDRKDEIRTFFSAAFKAAKDYAKEISQEKDCDGNLNSDIYLAIVQSIILLPADVLEWYGEKVFAAYTWLSHKNRSYEANQVSGYVALYLTLFPNRFNMQILDRTISETGEDYQDNKFVLQTRYAKWMMENNHEKALEYFREDGDNPHIAYIIALLADLDCKEALPLLKEKLRAVTKPVLREVYEEAISRLEHQKERPDQYQRMVWMFETLSPTERALRGETDNVFIQRVKKKQEFDDNVYETDEE